MQVKKSAMVKEFIFLLYIFCIYVRIWQYSVECSLNIYKIALWSPIDKCVYLCLLDSIHVLLQRPLIDHIDYTRALWCPGQIIKARV